MSDIDLLVVKGSADDAWALCRSAGWRLADPSWTEEMYSSHHHLPPLLDPDGINVGLELHRALLPGEGILGLDVGAMQRRSRTIPVGSVAVAVPALEDMLLHDCLHFAWSNKLQRGAWRAMADSHAIVGDPAFNWDSFLAVAGQARVRACCYWTLRLARVLTELPVPQEVLRALDPGTGEWWDRLLERHFVRQVMEPDAESVVSERVRRGLWLKAVSGDSGAAATDLWALGALDIPPSATTAGTTPRGPIRAALSTVAYLTRVMLNA